MLLIAKDSTGPKEWKRGGYCFEPLVGDDGAITVAQRLLVDTGLGRWAGLSFFAFGGKAEEVDALVNDWRGALKAPDLPVTITIPAYSNDPDVITIGKRLKRVAFLDNSATTTRCDWQKQPGLFSEGDMHWNMRCNRAMGIRAANTLMALQADKPIGFGRSPWRAELVNSVQGLTGVTGAVVAPTYLLYATHATGGRR